MNRLIENLWNGVGNVMDIAPPARRYILTQSGFAVDAARLRGDFAAVGRDLKKQLKREQTNYRTR